MAELHHFYKTPAPGKHFDTYTKPMLSMLKLEAFKYLIRF
jgi:hypothetical protein